MVVGDHNVHPQLLCKGGFLHGGDAAVHRDHQLHALAGELPQGHFVQAVALLQPAGYVGYAVRPMAAEKMGQQARGGDAVHIIVAEDGDFLAPGHGKSHPSGGGSHIRQGKGVRQRSIESENLNCLGRGLHAPGSQHHSGKGSVSSLRQRIHRALRSLTNIPNTVFHIDPHPYKKLFSIL